MKVQGIRGATTVSQNERNEILTESATLIKTIIDENNIDVEDIISINFTMTRDLDKAYPAVAVREILNITDVPLLNFEEKYIEGSLQKCIRALIYINTDKSKKDIRHVYLNNAKVLRTDIN
ncbi:chorismate mutase [Romboutsia weinsteinii]|uniref:chorismate mutase n=1 Tax=Romboutsia weinsteinii TaxID=2020949 RepID=A0A371J6Q4_9FIRM|nr:chorismate mutase [Romboutsia weinsteinii]RDY28357.1 chorismate mutase [Romboutsia weinsteinii]